MWFHKWTKLYRSLKQNTNNIVITLSGGMDSRVTFLLAKRSGINLNEIKVYSINDTLHTHAEDYQIASEIAKYFGFKLNYDNNLAKDSEKFSLKDNINIYIYNKLLFHKEMRCKYKKLKYKRYTFTGSGGENIRLLWNFTAKERTEHYLKVAKRYNNIISEKLKKSIKKIAKSNYDFIKSKYHIENSESKDITRFLYMDSRSRHHYGRESVDDYFTNNYVLSPLLDPSLLQIKLSTEDCHDNNLLLALIFIRYCPQLLNFKFEGNRFIRKSTIDYAIKINKLYPYKFQDIDFNNNFSIITEDKNIFVQNNSKSIVNTTIVNNFFKKLLESSKIKDLISEKFDKEIVNFAQKSSVVTNFYPLREIYPLISTALVLHSIKHENLDNKSNYDWLNKEISMVNEATMKKRELELKVDIFSDFLTSYRLDIKNFGKKNNGLEIKAKNGRIKKAKWFSDFQGEGKIVQGDSMANIIKIKAINNGILRVYFRGQDKKYNTKRIPVWVDYKSIKIDKKEILDHPISTWHDEPFKYEISVKDGQEITIEFEQQYHHYTKDELKDVLLKLNKTSVSLEEIMISLYDKFNKGSNH